jgi:hypothetical protein
LSIVATASSQARSSGERDAASSVISAVSSAEAAADGTVPDPLLVLDMENGQVITPAPDNLKALQRTPEWTKAILEAALRSGRGSDSRPHGS